MIFERIVVGPLDVNCYVIGENKGGEAIVIDPGGDAIVILDKIRENGLNVKHIVNTHSHFDHVGAVNEVCAQTGASFLIHKDGKEMLASVKFQAKTFLNIDFEDPPIADDYLTDGDIVIAGSLKLNVLHTPGHSPDGICLLMDDHLFTGDTLFAGSVGRTDLEGSSLEALATSIKSTILNFDDTIHVHPGHGPQTTIGTERHFNPILKLEKFGGGKASVLR